MATRNFCYIKDGDSGQALTMMNNVKFFICRRESVDDPLFAKLKNVVNSVIKHFEGKPSHALQRYNYYDTKQRNIGPVHRNWRN